MNVFAFSHRRAERLIAERLDEERGQGRLEPVDAEWLGAHLESCEACRVFESNRRKLLAATSAMKSVSAPSGFAARVMAAKARGAEPAAEEAPPSWTRFAVGGAVAAAALAAFVAVGTISDSSDTPGNLGVSGTGAMEQEDLRPHFVVRAVGLGPAKARAQAVSIIEAHGGRHQMSDGAIFARVPRDRLLAAMRDLSKQSTYKVARADAGELDPSLTEVLIKFELE
jgi:hypothetical protein